VKIEVGKTYYVGVPLSNHLEIVKVDAIVDQDRFIGREVGQWRPYIWKQANVIAEFTLRKPTVLERIFGGAS